MPLYELQQDSIKKISPTSFSAEGVQERQDLQRLLREQLEVVAPDIMLLSEEFGSWDASQRRIDLLGIDRQANLVVIELKRTQDGGHMELQSLRYAAMISQMTFEQAVETHKGYMERLSKDTDSEQEILNFLEWSEPDEENFAQDVRIVLVSAEFSKEITTTVMWLNERDLDIRCVKIVPYKHGESLILDVQQVVPLPEASDYQIQVREKQQRVRSSQRQKKDLDTIWREIEANLSADEIAAARDLQNWLESWATEIFATQDGFAPMLNVKGEKYYFLKITNSGKVQIWFQYLINRSQFEEIQPRQQLQQKLNQIPGVEIPDDRLTGKPSFPLSILIDESNRRIFKDAIDWAKGQIK
jgi:hypothetical protein